MHRIFKKTRLLLLLIMALCGVFVLFMKAELKMAKAFSVNTANIGVYTAESEKSARLILESLKDKITGTGPESDLKFCDSQSDKACITQDCPRPLSPVLDERVHDVLTSSNLSLSEEQLDLVRTISEGIPECDAILALACSSNHYDEMQAMFSNLHNEMLPILTDIHIVVFDLGLTPEERQMTEKACKCQVITFPFEKFPAHVREILCYAWKVLITRAVLEKAKKYVIYTDTSIRWKKETLNEYIARGLDRGMQLFASSTSHRIPLNTKREMFDYMGEEPCGYSKFNMVTASPAFYTKKSYILKTILNPLTRCALEQSCICPVKVTNDVMWCYKNVTNHRCHRFDQSAVSILTSKIFNDDIDTVVYRDNDEFSNKFRGIYRENKMPGYFKDLVGDSLKKTNEP